MIRLILVDDHPVVAAGLAARFATIPGFTVVGSAGSLEEAQRLATTQAVDIAVVDVQLETLLTPRQVTTLAAHCRVVLFSARTAGPYIRQLLDAGASVAVDKSAPLESLDAVLRDVHAGRSAPAVEGPASEARSKLSDREYEVYRALARCQTPKEVAATLGIATSTVYSHIESLRRKLGVQTLQEIVARASVDLP